MATFTGYLRSCGDDDLVALLRLRPDLASPSPSTLSSLAVRATSRASLERALAAVDAGVLQVLEAVVALEDPGPVTTDDLRAAVGGPDPAAQAHVAASLADAHARALVHPAAPQDVDGPWHSAPGLAELLGPYP
ncbi:hypothetical protein HLB10_19360, partial [Cellulomonas fimi]|nr:hypothetical protein [Cellulomonas fimi]